MSSDTAAAVIKAPQVLSWPVEVTFYRPRNLHVLLIGAGGTGARLATDVARLLSNGDSLQIMDFDRVEDKNLIRQHFVKSDVGRYKAEVVARRALAAATTGVTVEPVIGEVTQAHIRVNHPLLVLGCVDNRATRRLLHEECLRDGAPFLWIDSGNELRGGQVGMAGSWFPRSLKDPKGKDLGADSWGRMERAMKQDGITVPTPQRVNEYLNAYGARVFVHALAEEVPLILTADAAAEAAVPDCDVRLDTQSLAANVMAYATMIGIVSRILDELPITSGLTYFSTQNTMKSALFTSVTSITSETKGALLVSTRGTSTLKALKELVG